MRGVAAQYAGRGYVFGIIGIPPTPSNQSTTHPIKERPHDGVTLHQ